MIKLRRNDEALLAAALTGLTWSSVGLVECSVEDKKNLIIRWGFPEQSYWYPEHVSHNAIMETHPSILS